MSYLKSNEIPDISEYCNLRKTVGLKEKSLDSAAKLYCQPANPTTRQSLDII